MKRLGISKDVPVVCYDDHGIFSSPRCRHVLTYFGHPSVRILNGGFKKWKSEGRPTHSGEVSTPEEEGDYSYEVAYPLKMITDISEIH